MERLRIPFTCEDPKVDEDAVKQIGSDSQSTVEELARLKARAISADQPDSVVIGCDQAAVIDNRLLNKPGTADKAIAQLQELSGREHRLITAVAIIYLGEIREFTDIARMTMRELTDDEIHRYISKEQPLDCAGSYKIEQLGITLFERIDCRDYTAITGLPLMRLSHELRKLGITAP